jgi:hypothetical protein
MAIPACEGRTEPGLQAVWRSETRKQNTETKRGATGVWLVLLPFWLLDFWHLISESEQSENKLLP